jgi:hypothetical protein
MKGGRKGGLVHFGAEHIFTLIYILQLQAIKHREQIFTSEIEAQTFSEAHTHRNTIVT